MNESLESIDTWLDANFRGIGTDLYITDVHYEDLIVKSHKNECDLLLLWMKDHLRDIPCQQNDNQNPEIDTLDTETSRSDMNHKKRLLEMNISEHTAKIKNIDEQIKFMENQIDQAISEQQYLEQLNNKMEQETTKLDEIVEYLGNWSAMISKFSTADKDFTGGSCAEFLTSISCFNSQIGDTIDKALSIAKRNDHAVSLSIDKLEEQLSMVASDIWAQAATNQELRNKFESILKQYPTVHKRTIEKIVAHGVSVVENEIQLYQAELDKATHTLTSDRITEQHNTLLQLNEEKFKYTESRNAAFENCTEILEEIRSLPLQSYVKTVHIVPSLASVRAVRNTLASKTDLLPVIESQGAEKPDKILISQSAAKHAQYDITNIETQLEHDVLQQEKKVDIQSTLFSGQQTLNYFEQLLSAGRNMIDINIPQCGKASNQAKGAIQDYWELPGQHSCYFTNLDGKTYAQYLEKYLIKN